MEFNSLSVVYGKPSEKFLKDQALKQSVAAEKKNYPKERGFTTSQEKNLLDDEQQNTEQQNSGAQGDVDLLLDMGGSQ